MKLIVAALIGALSVSLPAYGQTYPNRAIRIIVPFLPGDAADILARLIGPRITERLGQQVIVDNRAGAAGQLGLGLAAHAAPDGYTLTLGQGGNLVVAPHTYRKLPYDPLKDFAPVALLVSNGLVLVVNPSTPFKNVADMIAYAKANPGKLSFASNGEGAFVHLSFELLRLHAGFTYLHVPYKSAVLGVSDVISGQVDSAMLTYASASPYIRAGKLRLLGTTNPARIPQLPDVPAIAETVPGYESRGWFGVLAPAGVPREVVESLNGAINYGMGIAEVKDRVTTLGFDVDIGPPEYFATTLKNDYAKFGKLVQAIGLQPQ
jgi:tripartite-type tricarboxylate transporter receptor subunit TctC